ncbi:MAG: Oxygen regulatory protein NreC, partial [Bacteroidota bacterium]
MITLVIAEDHQALIDGIKSFLKNESDIEIVGYANDGFDLIEIVRQLKPKVVITDIRMPKCDGILATKTIKTELPDTQVIAFSMFDHDDAISQMKEVGASGYIMKNSSLQTVLEAIRAVSQGYSYFVNEA